MFFTEIVENTIITTCVKGFAKFKKFILKQEQLVLKLKASS